MLLGAERHGDKGWEQSMLPRGQEGGVWSNPGKKRLAKRLSGPRQGKSTHRDGSE